MSTREMQFRVEGVDNIWSNYGIVQKVGSFEGMPKRYKVIEIRTGRPQDVVKSPGFMPVPTAVSRQITHGVAKELGLEILREDDDGFTYYAELASKATGEVEVGDLVRWGVAVSNRVTGNFRADGYMLRLACSNGMLRAEENEAASITKGRDMEKMQESLLTRVQLLQETFEEKLEFFRSLKQYRMNQRFAELLAKSFPSPIIQGVVSVKKKHVEGFTEKNLWQAYNDITYQLSHRKLKPSTRFSWGIKATRIFEEWVENQ